MCFSFFKADERSYFIVWSDGSVDRIRLPNSISSSYRLAFCVAFTAKRIGEQNLREIWNTYLTAAGEPPLKDGYIKNVAPPPKEEPFEKETYEVDSNPVTLSRIKGIKTKGEIEDIIRTEVYWKSEDSNREEAHATWGSSEKHEYSPIIGVCFSVLKHINSNEMFGSWMDRLPD